MGNLQSSEEYQNKTFSSNTKLPDMLEAVEDESITLSDIQPILLQILSIAKTEETVAETEKTNTIKLLEHMKGVCTDNCWDILKTMTDKTALLLKHIPLPYCAIVGSIIRKIGYSLSYFRQNETDKLMFWIENALDRREDSTVKKKAAGYVELFEANLAYLEGISDNTSRKESKDSLQLYEGIKFLAYLANSIEENADASDLEKANRAILLIDLYVHVALMRLLFLIQVRSFEFLNGDTSSAKATNNLIQLQLEKDKQHLKFLTKPTYSKAVFFATFNPSMHPNATKYIHFLKLQLQNNEELSTSNRTFSSLYWKGWNMVMGGDVSGTIWGKRKNSSTSKCGFILEVIGDPLDNTFYLRSEKWPGWYMYMRNNPLASSMSVKKKPGMEGMWKIINYKDENGDSFMFSPRRWPNYFVYMTVDPWGRVYGKLNNAGGKCRWKIE